MSNYVCLLTVKVGNGLYAIARIRGGAPDPGDLVELKDGTLAVVVTRVLYSELDGIEYQKSVAVATPKKVVAYYSRHIAEEDTDETP